MFKVGDKVVIVTSGNYIPDSYEMSVIDRETKLFWVVKKNKKFYKNTNKEYTTDRFSMWDRELVEYSEEIKEKMYVKSYKDNLYLLLNFILYYGIEEFCHNLLFKEDVLKLKDTIIEVLKNYTKENKFIKGVNRYDSNTLDKLLGMEV